MKQFILLLGVLFTFSLGAHAQFEGDSTQSQLYLVTKTDGASFYGYILKDDGREILLQTKTIGKLYINKSDIKLIKPVKESEVQVEEKGEYSELRDEGPFTTRYYLNTNGLPIKKGENYAMIHLYGPEVHFAVSDNLSLGVMASWIASPIAVAGKYSFDSESKTHFALGTILGSSGFLGQSRGIGGLHWATITQGDRMANVSLSAGYGYVNLGTMDFGGAYYGTKIRNYSYLSSGHYEQFNEFIYGTPDPTFEDRYIFKNFQGAFSFGISSINPVGKKASFILDVMGFIGKSQKLEYGPTQYFSSSVTQSDGSIDNRTFEYQRGIIVENGLSQTFLVMPGMRFNNKYGASFQVVLSGLVMRNGDGDVISIPFPMISWLRQF